jgi:hypothetical protein
MMRRATVNFIIDLVGFISLVGIVATGYIMKYVLPPGTGGRGQRAQGGQGGGQIRDLWSMTRHEWGSVHYYLALLFLVLMVVHIVMHWDWIKAYVKSYYGSRRG